MLSLDELLAAQKFRRLREYSYTREIPSNYRLNNSSTPKIVIRFEPSEDPRTGEITHKVSSYKEYSP